MPEHDSAFEQDLQYRRRDYRLTGPEAALAAEKGLVSATWYQCPVSRKRMKELMQRRDGPALRDTALWFLTLGLSGLGGYWFWGSWACVPFFIVYGVLYGSASNARWHETGHGTAFKTRWMNDALYHVSSFMCLFEPHVWRWSHARHHTDTIIVGRDPEIVEPRPPSLLKMFLNLCSLPRALDTLRAVLRHAQGRASDEERDFIPESELHKVFRTARIWLVIYALVIMSALYLHSWLPLMFIGLPSIYGGWLSYIFGITQHVGLAEDTLDHRTNCRTIYMNPVLRFLYMDMNYHLEHHMFPMVPYHALAQLHAEIIDDCPPPYRSLFEAYKEIIPTVLKQRKDPTYFVRRPLRPQPPATEQVLAES
ncbi:fatty acid desaturase family protein [Pseudomonas lijiangensis]|uniref:Fatty acid desaturase family protein n=1 Tax=Pseudomonas lijiangensis TaxID=2995658 RepID=A0ABX8HYN1_9PSED|nr:fatty acid desaturase family protein [Pseudomonas lijiangensis]MBX8499151.1 fatty acid desaturase family protein [Pseudomonas lijiangensis]MBX8504730.1 fatty acid desaturase family protein [Pseudomonas lijiangensis]MBX8559617.1 fatty acid desaturase family protein [Pseudomonas cichorii]QWU85122.1 fatty acid desaturase family protein [Pseudomonas lijiangensis]